VQDFHLVAQVPSSQIGKIVLKHLRLQQGERVLEIGCSIGTQARPLGRLGYRVIGVDTEFPLVNRFNQLARQDGIDEQHSLALVASGDCLPWCDHSFACVIATEVLEHTRQPEQVILEASRVLRPGGTICISVPTEKSERLFGRLHPQWFANSGHLHIFNRARLLESLRRAGLVVTTITGESFEWSLFWVVFAALRTPFDFTGTPTSHLYLVRAYWKMWRILTRLGIVAPLQRVGDRVFPKSLYVYGNKS
jgi:SAM-dependent methyltransferase